MLATKSLDAPACNPVVVRFYGRWLDYVSVLLTPNVVATPNNPNSGVQLLNLDALHRVKYIPPEGIQDNIFEKLMETLFVTQQLNVYHAFPREYSPEIERIIHSISMNVPYLENSFSAFIGPQKMIIPYRIYAVFDEAVLQGINSIQRKLLLCLFMRNQDGYVREYCLKKLFEISNYELFMIPYILKLVEEYVFEIIHVIYEEMDSLPGDLFRRFICENPHWLPLMYARCASYWDCYHKWRYHELREYPGIVIYTRLKELIS